MNLIFCKLIKPQKAWIEFFASLQKLKSMDLIFASLKKLKTHEFNFLQA